MGKIKQRIKGYIFIWVMLAISIFMFRYVREASRLEEREARDFSRMKYSNEIAFSIADDNIELDDLNKFFSEDVNLSAVEISLFLDDIGYCYMSEVIISANDYLYPIVKGSYPSKSRLDSGEPCVILGKELHKYTYKKNGKQYIKICGDEYEVTGYISMYESSVLDHRIILFNGCLSPGVKDDIRYYFNSTGIVCIVGFDSGEKEIVENGLSKLCKEYENSLMYDNYVRFAESSKVEEQHILYAKELFVFALLTLIMFGSLWMLQLRKEIAIRRAFGYSIGKILFGLCVKIIVLTVLSAITVEIVINIINIASGKIFIISKKYIFEALSDYVFSGIIIVVVLIVPCAISIIKNNTLKLLLLKNK